MNSTRRPIRATSRFAAVAAAAGLALPGLAEAAKFEFHGDLDTRALLYTNQLAFFQGGSTATPLGRGAIGTSDNEDNFVEIKYRLWVEAATDDGNVVGVYAIEFGGTEFGQAGAGGGFSGDGIRTETRWAYIDFAVPSTRSRARLGLQPYRVHRYLWNETATAAMLTGKFSDSAGYRLSWARGADEKTGSVAVPGVGLRDLDSFHGEVSFKPGKAADLTLFGLYQRNDQDPVGGAALNVLNYRIKHFTASKFDIYTLGAHGTLRAGAFTFGFDGMYQGGDVDNVSITDTTGTVQPAADKDLGTYFLRGMAATTLGRNTLSGLVFYASGDDDPTDGDMDAFITTDVDITDSAIIMQGHAITDDFHTESPYLADKGFFLVKGRLDHKASKKANVYGWAAYMATAEDLVYVDAAGRLQGNDSVGVELAGGINYKIYPQLALDLQAAYLLSGDAIDFFESGAEVNGGADNDIFLLDARIRYRF